MMRYLSLTKGELSCYVMCKNTLPNRGVKQCVNSHIHPHKLRDLFATYMMLESSDDLRAVQELLGHLNLSTI